MEIEQLKLTQFSPGAGCGCKISPKDLEEILKGSKSEKLFANLLVGNDSKDDAAVMDLGNGTSIISTTDFFTPIVDNPFDFGRIAATNAISDVYAMGGTPIMAIAILGWPLEKLPAEIAGEVIAGARFVCDNANIPLAGGHSISIDDPIFGLAVTGIVDTEKIKKNNTAKPGDLLFLTKPIGIGLVTTAEKYAVATEQDKATALELMTTLNQAGESLSNLKGVNAITDVTGFGLLGHSIEMAEGSGNKVVIDLDSIPKIAGVERYIDMEAIPGGTYRNFNSYGHKVSPIDEKQKALLCDPQTSGGLLISVEKESLEELKTLAAKENFPLFQIGYVENYEKGARVEVK